MTDPQTSMRRFLDERVITPRLQTYRAVTASPDPDPLPVARADLLYVWDEHHSELLDFALLSSPLGHRPQEVFSAVADHMRYYGLVGGPHLLRWPVSYAEALSDSFSPPGAPRRVLFCEGHRDALSTAATLACRRAERGEVLVVDTGWHDWLPSGRRISADQWSRVDWGRYAALVLSVVDADCAPVPSAREWMLCARTAGVPVIVDESVTGFGRTGTLWGQEHSGVIAEVTVLGGPVGGGLPLGAVVADGAFFDALEGADTTLLAGHPWACAAGQTTLEALHPGVLDHVAESSAALSAALDGLVGQFPDHLNGHHGLGLLRGLVFADRSVAAAFPRAARDHGLHLAPARGPVVTLAPALVSSVHEVTRGVDLLADTLMSWDDGGDQVNHPGSVPKP